MNTILKTVSSLYSLEGAGLFLVKRFMNVDGSIIFTDLRKRDSSLCSVPTGENIENKK